MIDIGLRIKQLRDEKNMTQLEFCNILGIKQANLSHIETKGKKISIEILYKIISYFNIDANWLIMGENDDINKASKYIINNSLPNELNEDEPYTLSKAKKEIDLINNRLNEIEKKINQS